MVYPLVSEAVRGVAVTVGTPYYNFFAIVFGLPIASKAKSTPSPVSSFTASTRSTDFELMTWTGVLFPKGVPQAVFTKLREAIVKTISDPAYVERQAAGGSEISPTTLANCRSRPLSARWYF